MGTKKREPPRSAPSALADALFTPVQRRVLGLLFGQPARRFQSAALIRMASSGTGATHRVLQRLAESGLVRVSIDGHQKYYQANADSPVFQELAGLVRKTVGLASPLAEALRPLGARIRAAFVFGSVAAGEDRADSDIDLMVIGEKLDYSAVFEAVQTAENRLGRSVNPTVMSPREWARKLKQADSFVSRVKEKPRIFVLGTEDDLG